jgi:hypothetical protein
LLLYSESTVQERVIEAANEAAVLSSWRRNFPMNYMSGPNAAVILATPKLASCLEDENFVAGLLRPFVSDTSHSLEFNILSAVVDGVPGVCHSDDQGHGLSFMLSEFEGSLPGLYDSEYRARSDSEARPSIAMSARPMFGKYPSFDVTVPLSNTISHDGRPFTMFASRWESQEGRPFQMTRKIEKETQRLDLPVLQGALSQLRVHLLPISEPRKIVSGLGNIVREVEESGSIQPASKELEGLHSNHAQTACKAWYRIYLGTY